MIASVLKLSRTDCKALGIKDSYSIHKAVYSLFPQLTRESRDFLFVDKGGDFYFRQILILSHRPPKATEYGSVSSKKINETFLNHDYYGFEVRLNPTKREKSSGKTIAVIGEEKLAEWFLGKVHNFGIEVEKETLQIQKTGVQTFEKNGKEVTHGEATFLGKLRVINREAFIRSFKQGIGRAKAFGFGLLQIVPLQK